MNRLPFVHGYADQIAGKGFLDNPYPHESNDFRIWIDGYVKSLQDHRPLSRRNLFAGHLGETPQPRADCPCLICRTDWATQRFGKPVHWHFGRWVEGHVCPDRPWCGDTGIPSADPLQLL